MVQDEARSTIIQIVDAGNNISVQVEFFSEISVNGGQNFELFHASERVFDDYSFRRKFLIMSLLLG